jgi:putative transposase
MAEKKKRCKRYSEEKIIRILQEVERGKSIAETCREHGISDQTFRNWRHRFSGMTVSELRELKRLEEENKKLKKILADQALKLEDLEHILSKKW